jgi:hypothetical protein
MLITYAEVADLAGASPSDAFLMRTVKATDTWAKKRLGRSFERATYILYPRGFGGYTIWLRESPIRHITEIRIDPPGVFGDDSIVTDLSLFTFNPDSFADDSKLTYMGRASRRWPFPEISNAIRVTCEAGWWPADDPDHDCDVPEDLRERLVERAVVRFKQGADEETQSVSQGDRSTTKFAETDTRILNALRHYKR